MLSMKGFEVAVFFSKRTDWILFYLPKLVELITSLQNFT